MGLKVLDRLFLRGFIGPCLLSFFIVEFVLVMQYLWVIIDSIMGKGYGMLDYLQLIGYFCVSEIPRALPLTILLSGVMVYGDMAEKYELYSAKSAGISFFRLLRPGLYVAIGVAFFSLFASNVLKPDAKRAFYTKVRHMKTNKLTFAFDEQIFNREFIGFSIRIGKKYEDGRRVDDVMIYDHNDADHSVLNMLRAKRGDMYTTPDAKYLIMDLYDGYQVTELRADAIGKFRKGHNAYARPMVRANFTKLRKIFHLEDVIDVDKVSVEHRKYDMMNAADLQCEIDTLQHQKLILIEGTAREFVVLTPSDSSKIIQASVAKPANMPSVHPRSDSKARQNYKISKSALKSKAVPRSVTSATVIPDADLSQASSLLDMVDITAKDRLFNKLKLRNQGILSYIGNHKHDVRLLDVKKERYVLNLHKMFSHALICILFLFIGAPSGAIVKKGGFGYPLLIAIIFYLVFIMTDIGGTKLVTSSAIPGVVGAWAPVVILLPFAVYLSWRALHDNRPVFGRMGSSARRALGRV